jgi:hypothetical protein
MVEACARGSEVVQKKHHYWVYFNGLVYRGLSTGEHGKKNPGIQIGIIKQMIRLLGIDMECARTHLPALQ